MNSYEPSFSKPPQSSWVKPVLALLLLILAGVLGYRFITTEVIGKYVPYESMDGRYKVCFFTNPHTDTQTINDGYLNLNFNFTSEHSATSYHCQVMYVDFSENMVQSYHSDKLYQLIERIFVRPDYQATMKPMTFDGYDGRILYIDTPNDGCAICRLFLDGNRMYQVLISNKDKTKMTDSKVNDFLNSFHILK